MQTQKELLNNLIGQLLNNGCPRETIVLEYKINNLMVVDLAVIDVITNEPIMLFVLAQRDIDNQSLICKFTESMKNIEAYFYLVASSEKEPYLKVDEVNICNGAIINSLNTLNFEYQRTHILSKKAVKATKDKNNEIDNFRKSSTAMACGLGLLFFLTKIGWFELNATDLTLIGGIIGLVLIPFASKIKFFALEFERYTQAKKE